MLKVVCIGAGKLAHQFMPALEQAECEVVQVYNRSITAAQQLSEKLKAATFTGILSDIRTDADFYVFAISDDAIGPLADQLYPLIPKEAIAVHCSGSLGLDVLPFKRKAGFYPLQSFSEGHEINWRWIPLIITTKDEDIWETLDEIAGKISTSVYRMTEDQKSSLHVAAVFANNFSNHMLTLASEICHVHQLPFDILKPLILETFSKAILSGPKESQTGPAIRNDIKTLDKHLKLLSDQPELADIYKVITASIRRSH